MSQPASPKRALEQSGRSPKRTKQASEDPVEIARAHLVPGEGAVKHAQSVVSEFLEKLEKAISGDLPEDRLGCCYIHKEGDERYQSILDACPAESRDRLSSCKRLRTDFETAARWCQMVPGKPHPFQETVVWEGVTHTGLVRKPLDHDPSFTRYCCDVQTQKPGEQPKIWDLGRTVSCFVVHDGDFHASDTGDDFSYKIVFRPGQKTANWVKQH